ncbi:hypothetical protein LEN26_001090 [Aphanomyces euteiches]|nr:hypothetical protein LEN26_020944 [Aphanomyces euteiches]KAH9124373.1 hypothetical protein LEN26_009721 [Aphanomyces euteiches]KAH9129016.1 hypothetical protein AeMF1_000889 [Aphanomyces euteiches]KAH9158929.1 hypothetical protein LEN26_002635 [Aphanomyces euteiches]KAH9161482.1 hypothetical protein LEN26_001379 [Aphanomyces euteiches]
MGGGDRLKTPATARSNRPPIDTSIDLAFALRRKEPFRPRYELQDMTAFVSALASCTNPSAMDEFILLCAREVHVKEKLTKILEFRYSEDTFRQLATPLLKVFTSDSVLHSPHATNVKVLLRLVFSCPLFFKRILGVLEGDFVSRDLRDTAASHLSKLLLILVKKLPHDAPLDDDFYSLICRFRDWCKQVSLTQIADNAEEALVFCEEEEPSRRPSSSTASKFVDYSVDVAPRKTRRIVEVTDAFALGPRHDNDAENINDIQVLPTDQEMRCAESPFLPLHPHSDAPLTDHIAFYFRLMREDALAQMRRGLQWWLDPSVDRRVQQKRHMGDIPRLHVTMDIQMSKLHGSIFKGVMFQLSAPQPWQNKTKRQLTELWERDRRYGVGSLVCIATQVRVEPEEVPPEEEADLFPRQAPMVCQDLIFATVAERDIHLLSQEKEFSISVKLIKPEETGKVMRAMSHGRNVLIEVHSLFFTGYEPILRALHQKADGISPLLETCLYSTSTAAWAMKPAYLDRPTYNFQFLRQNALVTHLQAVENDLILDGSQIDAFSAAMTEQVCLIQGPPGTGKSYVGARIVQGILSQPVSFGPILVVCYTNHALDQFLEGLIEDKIVPLSSIVRIGGRSKSDILAPCTLHELRKKRSESREESKRFWNIKCICKEIEVNTLDQFTPEASESQFLKWLSHTYRDEYEKICGILRDNDGFESQGGQNAQKKRFAKWKKGKIRDNAMWQLSLEEREQLLRSWQHEHADIRNHRHNSNLKAYQNYVDEIAEINNAQTLRLLRQAKIVGMTTTGCAMHQNLVGCLAPKVIICEEAGEVLEAHLLSCISSGTEHLIQIGDHKQLRPLVSEFKLSVVANNGYNLDMSMFERLVVNSGAPIVTLQTQRRMAPPICDLIRLTLYLALRNDPVVESYPPLRGFSHSLWFMDHNFSEVENDVSHVNVEEANMTVQLAVYALRQGYRDIAVLTPYLGQLVVLRNRLQEMHIWSAIDEQDEDALQDLEDLDEESVKPNMVLKRARDCLRLATVDNFQGNEAQLVIVSTVRSNQKGQTGFLKVFNRVNVMLSRAKHAMILLGSASTIRRSKNAEMFNKVLDILEDKNLLGPYIDLKCQNHGAETRVTSAQDMQRLVPHGGCQQPCDARLPCGHACNKLCHCDDRDHVTTKCLECTKAFDSCGHLCKQKCFEKCVCSEIFPHVDLPCGHVASNIRCTALANGKWPKCQTNVAVTIPLCGHEMIVRRFWKIFPVELSVVVREFASIVALNPAINAAHIRVINMLVCANIHVNVYYCVVMPAQRFAIPPTNALHAQRCVRRCACIQNAENCAKNLVHRVPSHACGGASTKMSVAHYLVDLLAFDYHVIFDATNYSSVAISVQGSAVKIASMVDMIMHVTLEDHDPDESPLVQLTCGHAFTIETLDGYLEFTKYYSQTPIGAWSEVIPLTLQTIDAQRKGCPLCRQPISDVRRYGRVLNFQQVFAAEQKYLFKMGQLVQTSTQKRATWFESRGKNHLNAVKGLGPSPSQEMAVKEMHYLCGQLQNLNLNSYRNTMQSSGRIRVQCEYLEVLIEVLTFALEDVNSHREVEDDKLIDTRKYIQVVLDEAKSIEGTCRAMCKDVSSFRSEGHLLVLSMKFRLILVQDLRAKPDDKKLILAEMEDVTKTCSTQVPSEYFDQSLELLQRAKKTNDGLTKEEKEEILKFLLALRLIGILASEAIGRYACPNGHPYVITECGGAMQESNCPECGAAIGGSGHNLLSNKQTAETFFNSQ